MKQIFFLLLLPAFVQAQTLSFGVKADSTGVYFIQQKVTTLGDSTETWAVALRSDTPGEVLRHVMAWREKITQDSAMLQTLFRENTRQRFELDRAAAQLRAIENPEKEQQETPEQEIERLRRENEALKKGKN